ncbi:MAG: LysM peptidoglycan-binding domain-containing protein [Gammaproteobacteria bacterium]|nr:LysM peptidoglycan-binding domain-containing protein [Gammaproteobacteria bacterium]MDH3373223.1 LysM peptidoglycan-binding domain-containing protein [Gammaproteobacteria bacterium]MDH3409606.1 LysM peptidoglycan-binding domain-containing protein [Gammaproteobacteria bacterium]
MGLLDFARDVGRQLFDTDDEAADSIKQHLEIKLSGIKNLDVKFDDGVATICGDCPNEATRSTALLIAGDVKGVERIIADDLTFPEPVEEEKEKIEFYEIVSGDTLGGIAKKFYGKASLYTRIHEANKELIPDPNKIYPGQKIKIPMD